MRAVCLDPLGRRAVARLPLGLLLALLAGLLGGAPAHAGDRTAPVDALSVDGAVLPSGVPAPPPVTARSWLVADLDTGDVLAAQSAHVPLPPASTIKLLTALALTPGLQPDQTWTATDADARIDGSKAGMVPGSVYTVDDMLHGLMLASGNDAASGLAGLAGGMDVATRRMQALADSLGATDTVVRNTSGLDAEGQVSSAFDLALVGRAALADPWVARLVATPRYQFPGVGTTFGPERPRFEIANHNRLLFGYDGALGLKNGYTVAARGSFVAAVERDGHRYLVSLMQAEGRTWRLARDLLDWAITNGPAVQQPVGSLDAPAEPVAAPSETPDVDVDAAVADLAGPVPRGAEVPAEDDGPPTWLAATGLVTGVLLLAVVALRARVLLRRRYRATAPERERVSDTVP